MSALSSEDDGYSFYIEIEIIACNPKLGAA